MLELDAGFEAEDAALLEDVLSPAGLDSAGFESVFDSVFDSLDDSAAAHGLTEAAATFVRTASEAAKRTAALVQGLR